MPALHALSPTDPRFPIGNFVPPTPNPFDPSAAIEARRSAIEDLAELPSELRNAVHGLDQHQLSTPYRDGGWTVRQIVHHIADSHMNADLRMRLALTEVWPTVKPYDERRWAELHDASAAPIEWSLELIEALHARWVMLLQHLPETEWKRGFIHPETGRTPLDLALFHYSWHGRHHTAHITHLRRRNHW